VNVDISVPKHRAMDDVEKWSSMKSLSPTLDGNE